MDVSITGNSPQSFKIMIANQYFLQPFGQQMDPSAAAALMGGMMGGPSYYGSQAAALAAQQAAMNSLFKTSLCKHFEQTGKCAIGNKCHFAHGKHELRSKDDVSIFVYY